MQDLTETRSLKHVFTAEDHLKNCDEVARLMDAQVQMELTHKEIKAGLKQEEEALSSNISKYVGFIRDKYEYRKTPCRWTWDMPHSGMKSLYRIDTWELVDVKGMEDYERQQLLKFMEENPPMTVQVEDDPPSAPVLEEVQPEITPGVIVDEDSFGVQEVGAAADEIEQAAPVKPKRKR